MWNSSCCRLRTGNEEGEKSGGFLCTSHPGIPVTSATCSSTRTSRGRGMESAHPATACHGKQAQTSPTGGAGGKAVVRY